MKYRVPRQIAQHPGVLECNDAVAGGALDYRHDVILKDGWSFKNGRMQGGRCGFFKNVSEFKAAEPVQASTTSSRSTSTQEFTDMATKKASKKATKKAAAKKAPAKKAPAKKAPAKKAPKKLDGKALAAKRKNRDSIAQYIKDQVAAGNTDVDAILESAKAEFPGKKPTRGYVRWIAKHQMGKDLGRAKAPASKKKAPAKTSVSTTLDPKTDDTDSQPAVDPAS